LRANAGLQIGWCDERRQSAQRAADVAPHRVLARALGTVAEVRGGLCGQGTVFARQ
jgi:hypothetical protein